MKRIYSKSKAPIQASKTQRNELCPCGSGKKAKYCCGSNTNYFTKVKKPNISNFEVSLFFIGEIQKVAFNLTLFAVRIDNKEFSLFELLIDKVNKIAKLTNCPTNVRIQFVSPEFILSYYKN